MLLQLRLKVVYLRSNKLAEIREQIVSISGGNNFHRLCLEDCLRHGYTAPIHGHAPVPCCSSSNMGTNGPNMLLVVEEVPFPLWCSLLVVSWNSH
jgi:hypothetical protein